MKLELEEYEKQNKVWPTSGRHVLAQYNQTEVIVYQAYRPEIGLFAAEKGYFGGAFSYTRMSWIKTNFLWMMYRCGWGEKVGQEVVLAIRLRRSFFDALLEVAFPSSNIAGLTDSDWEKKIKASDVRLQWDPDHCPYGHKVDRRAIQIGLRNDYLAPFKGSGIIDIENITEFVREQKRLLDENGLTYLVTPKEQCYPVTEKAKWNLVM